MPIPLKAALWAIGAVTAFICTLSILRSTFGSC